MSNVKQEIDWLKDNVPEILAVTGRIRAWLNNSESRLPVSCTVFSVEDSMEGRDGIEDSWMFTSYALRHGAGVAIDLSKLRPSGSNNGRGLIASGPVSFAKFYSLLNQELRRGGTYRNGAITLYLDFCHQDIESYLTATPGDLPWAKRAVYLNDYMWHSANPYQRILLTRKVNDGTVFLAKPRWNGNQRLYSNVCMEVLIPHRGSCLLSPVNFGQLIGKPLSVIRDAFVDGMNWLCRLHTVTGLDDTQNYYLPNRLDKQVGLGIIGLANYLAAESISYRDLGYVLLGDTRKPTDLKVWDFVEALSQAYQAATEVAEHYGMERAFAIAPTASTSYQYKDVNGYTCTPEISPPLWSTVDRNSDIYGAERYYYPPEVETTQTVEWGTQWQVLQGFQRLMNTTGKAHAISSNIWNSQHIDTDWIENVFLPSPLVTTYYRLDDKTRQSLDKTQIITRDVQECEACGG